MDESHCVDDLRGAVDVTPSHPSGGHGENANKHANVAPSQHDLKKFVKKYELKKDSV